MPNWLDRLLYRIAIETSWHGVNLPSRLIYRYRCPYPIIDDHSVKACIAAGVCGCDNDPPMTEAARERE